MPLSPHPRRNICVAYVPGDQEFLDEIEEILRRLQANSLLSRWQMDNVENDGDLFPDVDIMLLLISPSFIMSKFFDQAQERLLKKHETLEICVIPVLMRYTLWYDLPLAKLATLPPNQGRGTTPVAGWKNRAIAFERIGQGLIPMVEQFEQAQFRHMSTFLQEVSDAIARQQLKEFMERGLASQLFAFCERLAPLLPATIIPLLDRLAEEIREDQPDLSRRCAETAASLRLFSVLERGVNA